MGSRTGLRWPGRNLCRLFSGAWILARSEAPGAFARGTKPRRARSVDRLSAQSFNRSSPSMTSERILSHWAADKAWLSRMGRLIVVNCGITVPQRGRERFYQPLFQNPYTSKASFIKKIPNFDQVGRL